jgi:hypothetical protein
MVAVDTAALIVRLYEIFAVLEALHGGRHFTPDGHMVGSIGEVLVAFKFGLELVPASNKGYDARIGSKTVEIKATQGTRGFALRDHGVMPDHLIAVRIEPHGSIDVIYNGPAAPVWAVAGVEGSSGQRAVGIGRLRAMQEAVAYEDRLSVVRVEEG